VCARAQTLHRPKRRFPARAGSNLLYEELGRDYVTEGPVPAGRTGRAGRRNVNVQALDNDGPGPPGTVKRP
jgi:hypothetical protein